MSDTTSTAQQPSLHPSNILAHPGSTWAGVGVAAMAVGQQIAAGQMPTSSAGWGFFAFQIAMSLGAVFGK